MSFAAVYIELHNTTTLFKPRFA